MHFPIECRYVKGMIYGLVRYGRDSAYIAVHMYKGMKYAAYFGEVEKIFLKYEGRPHWGKCIHYRMNNYNIYIQSFIRFTGEEISR